MGMHFSFKNKNRLKPNRSWHQGVYAQLATEEEMVGTVYPGSRTIKEVVVSTRVIES